MWPVRPWEWVDTPPTNPVMFMTPVEPPTIDAGAEVELVPHEQRGWFQDASDVEDKGGPSRDKMFFVTPQFEAKHTEVPERPEWKGVTKRQGETNFRRRLADAQREHAKEVSKWEEEKAKAEANQKAGEVMDTAKLVWDAVTDVVKAVHVWELSVNGPPLRELRAPCCAGPPPVQFRLYPSDPFSFNFITPALMRKFAWVKKLVEKANDIHKEWKTIQRSLTLPGGLLLDIDIKPEFKAFQEPMITLDCQFIELTAKGLSEAASAAASNARVARAPGAGRGFARARRRAPRAGRIASLRPEQGGLQQHQPSDTPLPPVTVGGRPVAPPEPPLPPPDLENLAASTSTCWPGSTRTCCAASPSRRRRASPWSTRRTRMSRERATASSTGTPRRTSGWRTGSA